MKDFLISSTVREDSLAGHVKDILEWERYPWGGRPWIEFYTWLSSKGYETSLKVFIKIYASTQKKEIDLLKSFKKITCIKVTKQVNSNLSTFKERWSESPLC